MPKGYWSYVHQLSYRIGAPKSVITGYNLNTNLKPYSKFPHIWCLKFHYSPTEPKISHKPTPILLEPPRVGTQPFPNFPILTAKSPFPNLFHQLCNEITMCFLVKDGFQSPFQSPWPQKSPFQSPLVKSSQMSLMVSSHHWFSLVESPLVKSSNQKDLKKHKSLVKSLVKSRLVMSLMVKVTIEKIFVTIYIYI